MPVTYLVEARCMARGKKRISECVRRTERTAGTRKEEPWMREGRWDGTGGNGCPEIWEQNTACMVMHRKGTTKILSPVQLFHTAILLYTSHLHDYRKPLSWPCIRG